MFCIHSQFKLDSGHAQGDKRSVNRGIPVLDLTRGLLMLSKKSAASGDENVRLGGLGVNIVHA